jgi:hypothetical protein
LPRAFASRPSRSQLCPARSKSCARSHAKIR